MRKPSTYIVKKFLYAFLFLFTISILATEKQAKTVKTEKHAKGAKAVKTEKPTNVATVAKTAATTTLTLQNTYTLTVLEPSDLAFDKVNNVLYTVSDNNGKVYKLSTTGTVLQTLAYSGSDLEGVCMYKNNKILIGVEGTRQLVEYDYVTNTQGTTHNMAYVNYSTADSNSRLEGVTYDSVHDVIYFTNEKDPGALIVANGSFGVTNEYVLSAKDPDYSACHYVEESGFLWLASDKQSKIYKSNTSGTAIETFAVKNSSNATLNKLEGITIDYPNQILYAITDGDNKLYVYKINDGEPTRTWTGAIDTDWSKPGNWSPASVPYTAAQIIIPATTNKPVINADFIVSNLTIQSGATLTINAGKTLTNTGTITNSGTITNLGTINNTAGTLLQKSDATGTGSLLSDTSVVNVTQQHYLTSNQRGWRLLSNPLSTITFGTLASGSTTPITLGTNATGEYVPATNSWTLSVNGDANSMVSQKGYEIFIRGRQTEVTGINYTVTPPSNVTLSITGTAANTAPTSISTTAGKYYLVANPYTAPISVSRLLTASTGLSNSVSYYNPTKSSNGTTDLIVKKGGYNAVIVSGTAGAATDIVLPPMGAIFVQATTSGSINIPKTTIYTGTVTSPAGNFSHKTAMSLNAAQEALTINVSSNGVAYDNLQLKFKAVGTDGTNIDFGKLTNTILDFYSIAEENQNMAITELELKPQTIPLGINSTTLQEYKFSIAENSIPAEFVAVLEDKLLNTETVLTTGTEYSFTIDNSIASQGNQRFAINLKTAGSLSVADNVLDEKIVIWPNPAKSQFSILNNQNDGETTFDIYSIAGQLLQSKKSAAGSKTTINTSDWSSGIYIINFSNNGNKTTKKLIIQ